jgi:hypothetical protein
MAGKSIVELCELGEAADQLYLGGDYEGAEDAYMRVLRKMKNQSTIDSYLMSKLTLGMMLTLICSGKIQDAFNIWTASIEKESSLFGIGIHGLENGQVSVKDTMLYDFICAYFHSLSGGDPKEAAEALNFYMNRICDYAKDNDPELLPTALSNWILQIHNIFEGPPPKTQLEDYEYWAKELGKTETQPDVQFPEPSKWVPEFAANIDEQEEGFVPAEGSDGAKAMKRKQQRA